MVDLLFLDSSDTGRRPDVGHPDNPEPDIPPIELDCGENIETAPLIENEIRPSLRNREHSNLTVVWTVDARPAGSTAELSPDNKSLNVSFTPDLAGEYWLYLQVQDSFHMESSCTIIVRAFPKERLRIEAFWNGPPDNSCADGEMPPGCDGTDVDLHLLSPQATVWFDDYQDCHYANCVDPVQREWGEAGELLDDPRLDIDDERGYGPENINLVEPQVGRYSVGIHFFSGKGSDNKASADVTVRVYCDGTVTEFGPVVLRGAADDEQNDFWRVADVEISDSTCNVLPRGTTAAPDIVTTLQAREER